MVRRADVAQGIWSRQMIFVIMIQKTDRAVQLHNDLALSQPVNIQVFKPAIAYRNRDRLRKRCCHCLMFAK